LVGKKTFTPSHDSAARITLDTYSLAKDKPHAIEADNSLSNTRGTGGQVTTSIKTLISWLGRAEGSHARLIDLVLNC
jgi:hypothetical protein